MKRQKEPEPLKTLVCEVCREKGDLERVEFRGPGAGEALGG